MSRWLVAIGCGSLVAGCTVVLGTPRRGRPVLPAQLTFDRVTAEATDGDPVAQNLLGYMYFTGESAPHDWEAAHRWFEAAAARGVISARFNLALMHEFGLGVPRSRAEAEHQFGLARASSPSTNDSFRSLDQLTAWACQEPRQTKTEGAEVYGTFCSGCHGWRGIAAYGEAPSFALGERMEKSDGELLNTIVGGHGEMPSWRSKLPWDLLEAALGYARTLRWQYRDGIIHVVPDPPPYYFRFGPMSDDHGMDWRTRDFMFRPNPDLPRDFCRATPTLP